MAKTKNTVSKTERELTQRLRDSGIRKKSAELIARSTDGRKKPAKQIHKMVDELNKLVDTAEDRLTGGPAKRATAEKAKRSAAAKKGAETRKRNAAKRSATAKKGPKTKANSST